VVSLLFFVVVTVVLVVVDPPVVGAFVAPAAEVSMGAVVTDVVDDAETVVSAVDCLDGAHPPSTTAAAIKADFTMVIIEDFTMVIIDCSGGFAR
jgi:type IV secretory pathway TrbL component